MSVTWSHISLFEGSLHTPPVLHPATPISQSIDTIPYHSFPTSLNHTYSVTSFKWSLDQIATSSHPKKETRERKKQATSKTNHPLPNLVPLLPPHPNHKPLNPLDLPHLHPLPLRLPILSHNLPQHLPLPHQPPRLHRHQNRTSQKPTRLHLALGLRIRRTQMPFI